jgi:hypothetical protein
MKLHPTISPVRSDYRSIWNSYFSGRESMIIAAIRLLLNSLNSGTLKCAHRAAKHC